MTNEELESGPRVQTQKEIEGRKEERVGFGKGGKEQGETGLKAGGFRGAGKCGYTQPCQPLHGQIADTSWNRRREQAEKQVHQSFQTHSTSAHQHVLTPLVL